MFKGWPLLTLGNNGGLFALEKGIVILRSLGPGESAESPAGRGTLAIPAPEPIYSSEGALTAECAQVPWHPEASFPDGTPRSNPSFLRPLGCEGPARSPAQRGYLEPASSPASSRRSRSRAAASATAAATTAATALTAAGPAVRASPLPRGSTCPRPIRRVPLPGVPGGRRLLSPRLPDYVFR